MQEENQPEVAAENVEPTEITAEARIAELEAALEEAKASVLYVCLLYTSRCV